MDPRLKLELDGAVFKHVSKLIETVFPDDVLPRPASDLLLSLSSGKHSPYNSKKENWRACPKLNKPSTAGTREYELAKFFNSIGSAMEQYVPKNNLPARKWTSRY